MSSPDRSYNNRLAPLVGFFNHLFKYWPHTHFCYMMIKKKKYIHERYFFSVSSGTVVEYAHFTDTGLQNITMIYLPTRNVNMSLG